MKLLKEINKFEGAIQSYEKAIELDSSDTRADNNNFNNLIIFNNLFREIIMQRNFHGVSYQNKKSC